MLNNVEYISFVLLVLSNLSKLCMLFQLQCIFRLFGHLGWQWRCWCSNFHTGLLQLGLQTPPFFCWVTAFSTSHVRFSKAPSLQCSDFSILLCDHGLQALHDLVKDFILVLFRLSWKFCPCLLVLSFNNGNPLVVPGLWNLQYRSQTFSSILKHSQTISGSFQRFDKTRLNAWCDWTWWGFFWSHDATDLKK